MKKRFLMPFVVLSLAFSSCSVSNLAPAHNAVEEVSDFFIAPSTLSVDVGNSEYVVAHIDSEAEDLSVSWRVNGFSGIVETHETIRDGLPALRVDGLKKGTVQIVATCEDKFAFCDVSVGGAVIDVDRPVTGITVNPTAKTVVVKDGEQVELTVTATIEPIGATNGTVSWTSSNADVAVLGSGINSSVGLVTVKATGRSTITATAGGFSATCEINAVSSEEEATFKISMKESSVSVVEGETYKLGINANDTVISQEWKSNNEGVATVGQDGNVVAHKAGEATITVTATNGKDIDTAQCVVTVTAKSDDSDEYAQKIAAWSKAGHLYIHYKRTNGDYDKWAVWAWQKKPNDSSGSLWGATMYSTTSKPKGHEAAPMSFAWMNKEETGGTGSDLYTDEHGEVLDIDLTNPNIVSGETGKASPIIAKWDEEVLYNSSIGFLIVDQTKMNGGSHWTSDGGIESYIEDLDLYFTVSDGKPTSYLHIYCVQGSVSSFTTSSGATVKPNPTATDTTGNYRSQNDITNLLADHFSGGVATSDAFQSSLDDRPGTGYQIFVPSFADSNGDGFGDIKGITQKLDYLKDLGVDVLWLTPIQKSGSYHGYDVTDYYKIDSKFGTMEDYQELLYKAHKNGMKVLMDMVINHTSKNNVLFTKSQRGDVEEVNGKTINYRNMYLWKFKGDKVRTWDGVVDSSTGKADPANYISVNVEDANDWYQDGDSNYYYYGKFGSGMAELNYSCQATRDYMTDMCKYWLSFGLDGFRLDAIKHIYLLSELSPEDATKYPAAAFKVSEDGQYQSGEIVYDASYRTFYDNQKAEYVTAENDYSYHRALNVKFWKEFAGVIKSAYPNCFLVGENFDGWNARISSFYDAMDSQFDFSTYYHLNGSTSGGAEVANMGGDLQATQKWNNDFRKDHINGSFTSNHDVARFINHAASTTMNVHHVEVSASNRSEYEKRAKWFAAITILNPGVSWIYYGDEIGLSGNLEDKVPGAPDDHGNNVDRWYRQPMRWGKVQGEDNVTKYAFSGLDVTWDNYSRELPTTVEQQADENSLYSYFKALCHTKGDSRYPTYGTIKNQWRENSNPNFLAMQISDGYRTVNVFVNATGSTLDIAGLNQGTLIGGSKGATGSSVPAWGFAVVQK